MWVGYPRGLADRQLSSPWFHLDAAALAAQSKSSEDIIKFSKFPAAQAPDPSEIPKIETDHWPGPPSLAAVGMRLLQLSQMDRWLGDLKTPRLKICREMSPLIKVFKKNMTRGRTVERTNVVLMCVQSVSTLQMPDHQSAL